jgi:hypothetical protein
MGLFIGLFWLPTPGTQRPARIVRVILYHIILYYTILHVWDVLYVLYQRTWLTRPEPIAQRPARIVHMLLYHTILHVWYVWYVWYVLYITILHVWYYIISYIARVIRMRRMIRIISKDMTDNWQYVLYQRTWLTTECQKRPINRPVKVKRDLYRDLLKRLTTDKTWNPSASARSASSMGLSIGLFWP